jgi:hypothetical protein
MPISTDDSKLKTKYYDKSMNGCCVSFLFFAIIFTLIILYAY